MLPHLWVCVWQMWPKRIRLEVCGVKRCPPSTLGGLVSGLALPQDNSLTHAHRVPCPSQPCPFSWDLCSTFCVGLCVCVCVCFPVPVVRTSFNTNDKKNKEIKKSSVGLQPRLLRYTKWNDTCTTSGKKGGDIVSPFFSLQKNPKCFFISLWMGISALNQEEDMTEVIKIKIKIKVIKKFKRNKGNEWWGPRSDLSCRCCSPRSSSSPL